MTLKELIRKYILENKNSSKIVYDNSSKVLFIGDIHGDFDTIIKIKNIMKDYDKVVFLGDYVDRGRYGYEVLKEILESYLKEKDKIVLLKGNHENLLMNKFYGFYEEILKKESDVLEIIEEFYNSLKLIYINNRLKIFAVHGGINIVPEKLEELLYYEEYLLWSDFNWGNPCITTYNIYRGVGVLFGLDLLKPFMEKFNFKYFVRGHEYFEEGIRIFEFGNKFLITLFSSNEYPYNFVKKKILEINKEGYKIIDLS